MFFRPQQHWKVLGVSHVDIQVDFAEITKSLSVVRFLFVITCACVMNPVVGITQEARLPPVINQTYDDDCGIAALRMLLQRSGIQVSDSVILASLPFSSDVDALSATDLKLLVRSLNLGVVLEDGYIPLENAASVSDDRPFLILLEPSAIGGNSQYDHFVLVEGRFKNNFLIADPILSERVLISDDKFDEYTHGKIVADQSYVKILRLVYENGDDAALPVSTLAENTRIRSWRQSYELPRLLPKNKSQISISYAIQGEHTQISPFLKFGVDSSTAIIEYNLGITSRTQVGFSLSRDAASTSLTVVDESFSIQDKDIYAIGLHIEHLPDFILPPSIGLSTFATIIWDGSAAITTGAKLVWNEGGLSTGLDVKFNYDDEFSTTVTPSVRYRFSPFSDLIFDAALSVPFQIEYGYPEYLAEVSVSRQFEGDFQVGLTAGTRLFDEISPKNFQIGLKMTYGIPRRFRD